MDRKRYIEEDLEELCFSDHKMAFISGPRQCGKTTVAKRFLRKRKVGNYFNWDEIKFRRLWTKDPSLILPEKRTTQVPLIVLDEIHKAKLWKRNLKGVYDTLDYPCDILVTGSARLNVFRKGSDSLLGRYYLFRLHPFSLKEMLREKHQFSPDELLQAMFSSSLADRKVAKKYLADLSRFGPFPEPLLEASPQKHQLWQQSRVEKVIREDLRDLSRLPELSQVEMLTSLLPEKVGSLLSLSSLARDLEVAYTTVKRWLNYLNELYYFFEIKPYSKSLPKSIRKSGKIYLWDWSEIENEAARFENLIASHLLKYCHFLTDTGFGKFSLSFLRDKNKREIDFLVLRNGKPWFPVEVKLNNHALSENWLHCLKYLPCKRGVQVTKSPNIFRKKKIGGTEVLVISADRFLRYLS